MDSGITMASLRREIVFAGHPSWYLPNPHYIDTLVQEMQSSNGRLVEVNCKRMGCHQTLVIHAGGKY